jgi:hypothetical protein
MAINSTTARGDIVKEFVDLLTSELTTTTVATDFSEDVTELPIVVVGVPQLPRKILGFGGEMYDRSGPINIDIYANTMKDVLNLTDAVEDAIFSNKSSLGVHNIQLGESTPGTVEVGDKVVYVITLPFDFKFMR